MKRTCLLLLLAGLLLLSPIVCFGEEPDAGALAEEILSGVLAGDGAGSTQEWLNGTLCEGAGRSSEWYVIALAQSGEQYDFSAYERALTGFIGTSGIRNAATRQKYALALASVGSADEFIRAVLDETIGTQGVMSWIYGLHLLNNGYMSASYTAEEVRSRLLSLRLPDGGWAISGSVSDVDVTSMALQALSPDRERDEVKEAINGALELLSARQLPDGDFSGFGVPNAESTAQVLIALAALDIDITTDARFLKDSNSVLTGLLQYRTKNGSFRHSAEGEADRTATEQAFLAMVALQRQARGAGSVYLFDLAAPEKLPAKQPQNNADGTQDETQSGMQDGTSDNTESPAKPGHDRTKLWISLALAGAGALVCLLFFFVLKKRRAGDYLLILGITAVAILLTCTVRIQSPGAHDSETAEKGTVVGTVTISVRCDAVAGMSDSAPADGVILKTVVLELGEKDTVLSLLREAARKADISLDVDSGYVRGIGGLYEFDFGALSGWLYQVNGEHITVGSKEYRPADGDVIEWIYTQELNLQAVG